MSKAKLDQFDKLTNDQSYSNLPKVIIMITVLITGALIGYIINIIKHGIDEAFQISEWNLISFFIIRWYFAIPFSIVAVAIIAISWRNNKLLPTYVGAGLLGLVLLIGQVIYVPFGF